MRRTSMKPITLIFAVAISATVLFGQDYSTDKPPPAAFLVR